MLDDGDEVIEEAPRNKEHLGAGKHCIMGIDEAGRGPVLGPMVYAAFICIPNHEAVLKQSGFADSKTVSEAKREELLSIAKRDPYSSWFVRSLSAELLSRDMLRRGKINLNTISHATAASLVRCCLDKGLIIDKLCVDTVGDPRFYKKFLTAQFDSIPEIIVSAKADSIYPVVSAASIIAKTTRDSRMHGFVLREAGLAGSRHYGSGYPGDPETKKWLKQSIDPVFGFPSVVRFSWKTCQSLMDANSVDVQWEDDGETDEQVTNSTSPSKNHQTKLSFGSNTSLERYRFFSDANMESVQDI